MTRPILLASFLASDPPTRNFGGPHSRFSQEKFNSAPTTTTRTTRFSFVVPITTTPSSYETTTSSISASACMDIPNPFLLRVPATALTPLDGSSLLSSSMMMVPASIRHIQRIGETVFVAMFVVALIQAIVALIQYRTNPSGELMVPPGLTCGVCHPSQTKRHSTSFHQKMENSNSSPSRSVIVKQGSIDTLLSLSNDDDDNNATTATAVLLREETTTLTKVTLPPEAAAAKHQPDTTTSSTTISKFKAPSISPYTKFLNRVNQWLFVLIPMATRRLAFLVESNTHIFHLGFIVTLSSFFDIPNRWFLTKEEEDDLEGKDNKITTATTTPKSLVSTNSTVSRGQQKTPERLIVIGDSLAVGLGSVNAFDPLKNGTWPFAKLENVNNKNNNINDDDDDDDDDDDHIPVGPVFPKVLAETMAEATNSAVRWRSAGVDGGDTSHIHKYLLEVVRDEVNEGRPPDIVVILCGINDLKYAFGNLRNLFRIRNPAPRVFRLRLQTLIDEIHALAPNCVVVLPSLPTQMFHRNSPLNIFPLNFFLDTIVGFWDSQKKLVAEQHQRRHRQYGNAIDEERDGSKNDSNSSNAQVVYVRLGPSELMEWYRKDERTREDGGDDDNDVSLLAADGVHPNARCYSLWASSLGERLASMFAASSSSSASTTKQVPS